MPDMTLERAARSRGFAFVCGCDEAGAGPLAGPVYAAAVILPEDFALAGLDDSKKLSPGRREALFGGVTALARAWAVACVGPEEIDRIDILNARIRAMRMAVEMLDPPADYVLIDGNRDRGSREAILLPHETVVRGDARSMSVAAASILAKVSRDRYMEAAAEEYPGYGFERHKGYGTREHYAALDRLGPCPLHRRSFLRKWEAGRGG